MKILKSLPKEIDITDEFDVNDYEDDEDKLLDDIPIGYLILTDIVILDSRLRDKGKVNCYELYG